MCVCRLTSITDVTFIQFTYVTETLFYILLMISIFTSEYFISLNYTPNLHRTSILCMSALASFPAPPLWNTNIEPVQGSLPGNETSEHHSGTTYSSRDFLANVMLHVHSICLHMIIKPLLCVSSSVSESLLTLSPSSDTHPHRYHCSGDQSHWYMIVNSILTVKVGF